MVSSSTLIPLPTTTKLKVDTKNTGSEKANTAREQAWDQAREDALKEARRKEQSDRVRSTEEETEPSSKDKDKKTDSNFESWMAAFVTVTPQPTNTTTQTTGLDSLVSVTLQNASPVEPNPATNTTNATAIDATIDATATTNPDQTPVVPTTDTVIDTAAVNTTETASLKELTPDQMTKFIAALNHSDALKNANIQVVPSNANKEAINQAVTNNPELLKTNEGLLSLVSNLQTKPTTAALSDKNGQIPSLGLEARISNITDVKFSKPTVDKETTSLTNASNSSSNDTDKKSETVTNHAQAHAHNTHDQKESVSITESSEGFDGLVSNAAGTNSNSNFTVPNNLSAVTATQIPSSGTNTTTLPQTTTTQATPAAEAVAAVVQKNVKDGINGSQSITLRLDPVELGRMDVRMEYKKGDPLKVHLVVEKSDTLEMFQKNQHALETALTQAGINANDVNLSFELNQNAFQNAFNQQSNNQSDGSSHAANNNNAATSGTTAEMQDIASSLDIYINPNTGRTHYNMMV